jgi:hypothetical protein
VQDADHLHNIFSEQDNYYIAVEFMPGGTLEQRLSRDERLTVGGAVQIAADVNVTFSNWREADDREKAICDHRRIYQHLSVADSRRPRKNKTDHTKSGP